MKPIALSLWLLTGWTLAAQTPPPASPVITCKGPNAKPCTEKQLNDLLDAVVAQKAKHDILLPVKNLTLASPNGIVKCIQNDESPCTTAQLDQVKTIASDQKLYFNYNARPNTAK